MKKTVFIALISCFAGALQAQDAIQVPGKLSYKEAVRIAIRNNFTLNQTKNELENVEVMRASSYASIAPSVSGTLTGVRIDGNSFNQNEGKVENGIRDNVSGSIDASMMLFNGFNRINTVKSTNDLVKAQMNLIVRSEQKVISDVSSQYLQVLLDQELMKIAERNVELQKAQLDQIKNQVEVGSKAEVDQITQDALVKGAELAFLRARVTLRNDKATLAQTMLIDPQTEFALEEPQWDANFTATLDQPIEQLYTSALNNRADYLAASHTESSAHHSLSATKSRYYPNLAAFATYGSGYNKLQGSEARTFNDQFFNDNTYFQYGLQLSIPIFNGLTNRLSVVRSRTLYKNATLAKANIENTVKSDVLRAYQNFQDAIAAYQAADAQNQASEASIKLEKDRYDLGITDLVQFSQSSQNFVKAQGDFAQAKYTLWFQRILLDYAVGTLKFDNLP